MKHVDLLEESFPGIKASIQHCQALGFSWSNMTFLKEEISHVGFLEYPIMIEGKLWNGGALHAICTKASHRGQGFASSLIQEALAYAKGRCDFVVLYTDIPKFYERLSFRCMPEHRFRLSYVCSQGSKKAEQVTFPKHNNIYLSMVCERVPVSNYVWMEDLGPIITFNTLFGTFPIYFSLYYCPWYDVILSFQLKEKTLHLFDIIAEKMPTLDEILDCIPGAIEEIYFYFPPDRFTDAAIPEPFLYNGGHLMVHGNFPDLKKPFMIAPLSQC